MDCDTRLRLNRINRAFYAGSAAEFDATRRRAWAGWRKMQSHIELPLDSVLDIGCGNGRFAHFIAENQPEPFAYVGVDSSGLLLALARERLAAEGQIQAELIKRDIVADGLPGRPSQLVVLFGLLHHVPGERQRRELLSRAAEMVLRGGYLVFAAWRFYEDARLRERIVPWDEAIGPIAVERNDFLLDWWRGERALRYCHYIDDAEHDELAAVTGLSVAADFRADGASGSLNRYTVLRRG